MTRLKRALFTMAIVPLALVLGAVPVTVVGETLRATGAFDYLHQRLHELPPLPAVVYSTRGMARVELHAGIEWQPKHGPARELAGQFMHWPRPSAPDSLVIRIDTAYQDAREQWITLEHERVHLALWAEGVALPDDVEEKVAEGIAQQRVAEMEYQRQPVVVPNR